MNVLLYNTKHDLQINIDFVQQHKKINVSLQITKITKHVSSFEFEEEYEEI